MYVSYTHIVERVFIAVESIAWSAEKLDHLPAYTSLTMKYSVSKMICVIRDMLSGLELTPGCFRECGRTPAYSFKLKLSFSFWAKAKKSWCKDDIHFTFITAEVCSG